MNIQKQRGRIAKKLREFQAFLALKKKMLVFGIMVVPLTSAGAGMTIYIDNLSSSTQNPIFAQESVINLDESISIKFSAPVQNKRGYEDSIGVYPKTAMIFDWNEDQTLLTITPKTIWKPQTQYSLAFPQNAKKAALEKSTIFSFTTVAYPVIINTSITETQENYIDVGDDIVINFDTNIRDFDVQAVTRPMLATEQIYNEQTHSLHIHVKEKSKNYNGFHSLTIFAKHKKQQKAQFYPIHSLTFNTLLPTPKNWPKAQSDRLTIARLSTAPKIKDGKYVDVNLDAQVTTLFENGKFIENFISSTGATETPTPTGTYEIYNKHPYALSNMFGVYLPYWLAFTEDGLYGFHGLVVWPKGHEDMPSGGKESTAAIGNAVSAGCVRHDAQKSKRLYDWVDIGTKVVIY